MISPISVFSMAMGLIAVGNGLRLPAPTADGKGFSPLDREFRLVGMGFTSVVSRHELATRAMAGSTFVSTTTTMDQLHETC